MTYSLHGNLAGILDLLDTITVSLLVLVVVGVILGFGHLKIKN